ncbi:GNAT family N-acetyltransferase [Arenibaculum pallidiluteum]|uniref:GNAT family N-acetyltransferase n=1 Tax=Arenibaculum pallidiluteum TaxID=2812559 RepID=UPI001B3BE7D0|nr:GNAT family N-acetyltransferase [Arenibaculum pallidiluteum]
MQPPDLRIVRDAPTGQLRKVVTFLEMAAKPDRVRPLRPPAERLALLRAERPTVSFYRYLYDTVGERWLWADRRRMDAAAVAATVQDPRVEVYVLYKAGVPAGFAELDRRGAAVDLAYFGLIPDFIGQKLGPWFLDWAVDAAWAGQCTRLTVNTCSFDHPKALTMYQRAGFMPVRQVTEFVEDPRLTGQMPRSAAPQIALARTEP